MDNTSLLVQISECFCNLNDGMSGEVFGKVGETNNLVEEFAAWTEFEDDVVVLSGFGKVD
jgi:hypothetical protein